MPRRSVHPFEQPGPDQFARTDVTVFARCAGFFMMNVLAAGRRGP